MSRTLKHKLNGMFNNGLIDSQKAPLTLWKFWNRQNYWTGKFRSIRKEKIAEMNKNELNDIY